MRKHIIWTFDQSLLQNVLDTSSSYDELFKKLGLQVSKSLIKMLRYRTKKEKISHKKFICNNKKYVQEKILSKNTFQEIPIDEVLVENSTYVHSSNLKNRLVKSGLLQYKCSICDNSEWMNKPLTLQLDHINGKNNDNRIENLRLLCPNCHSQTDTYAGKKKKEKIKKKLYFCGKCGVKVENKLFCNKCDEKMKLKRRKVERPPYNSLMNEIKKNGYSATGRKYGVSDVSIKKWQKQYEKNMVIVAQSAERLTVDQEVTGS